MNIIKPISLFIALCCTVSQTYADSVFTYAMLKLPFEVQSEESWSEVISNQQQWQQFYSGSADHLTIWPAGSYTAPQIDFDAYDIVVDGMNYKSSHSDIMVQYLTESSNITYLGITIVTPGNCTVTMDLRYPNIAILVPKLKNELKISTRVADYFCPQA